MSIDNKKTDVKVIGPSQFVAKLPKNNHAILSLSIALIVVAGGGYYFVHNYRSNVKHTASTQAPSYKYTTLVSHKSSGSQAGSGIVYSLPKEFTASQPVAKYRLTSDYSYYVHTVIQNKTTRLLGMALVSTSASTAPPAVSADAAKTLLEARFPALAVTVTKPQPFYSQNIKANAWSFGFVVSKAKSSKSTVISGELIYVIGAKSYYNFAIATTSTNWAANQQVLHQIISSLKIDQ